MIAVTSALARRMRGRRDEAGHQRPIAFKRYLDASALDRGDLHHGSNGTAMQQVTKPAAGRRRRPARLVAGRIPDRVLPLSRPTNPCEVYTVKPDGSALDADRCRARATDCEDGEGGSFLPDGKRVVYTRATRRGAGTSPATIRSSTPTSS